MAQRGEQTLDMAWEVEATYGRTPPAYETANARWTKAEVRKR